MNFKCFITLWLLKDDKTNSAKVNEEIMRKIVTKNKGIAEETKIAESGRRVTLIAHLDVGEGQNEREIIDKICKAISEETGRKVAGRPLKK